MVLRRSRVTHWGSVFVAVIVAVLLGCGGTDEQPGDAAPAPERSSAAAPEPPAPPAPPASPFGPGGPGEGGPLAGFVEMMMQQLDANKDGSLTKEEIPEPRRAMLMRADSNGDGMITLEELKALPMGPGRPGRGAGMGMALPDPGALVRRFDADDDGKLARDELPEQQRDRMMKADTDGDGFLSVKELQAARGPIPGPRGRPGGGGMGAGGAGGGGQRGGGAAQGRPAPPPGTP